MESDGPMIPVVLAGASGRTGRVVGQGIVAADDMALMGVLGQRTAEQAISYVWGEAAEIDLTILAAVEEISTARAVLVDFTDAESAVPRILIALERGWDLVVGTTGFTVRQLDMFAGLVREARVGAAFIPNFSLGAWALEQMAALASQHCATAEIIESHAPGKKDRPSGTSKRVAAILAEQWGMPLDRIPVHSIRLDGMVAHQMIVFGGAGQVITIRHDVHDRTAYVPGVLAAIRAVRHARGSLLTSLGEVWPVASAAEAAPRRPLS
jgi:4-hydroxy-tetrahydrodipicolinate reductase